MFPGNPHDHSPCSSTPAGPSTGVTGPWVNGLDTAPAPKHNEGSPRLQISGLNHTAFGLAVYASKWRLPATAQDSLPAAGPSFAGRDSTRRVSMKGF